MRINIKSKKDIVAILIVAVFAVFNISALFFPGLIPTHDGEYHVLRFWQFSKSLSVTTLYPRWAPDFNNGYGIPLFLFVYPLPNYVSVILHFFGMSFIDSFKYNLVIATILGAFFFYLWSRMFWGRIGGVVSSIFYIFAPYHFLDIFVRGSVGEVWVLSWLPAVLWMATKTQRKLSNMYAFACGIFFALLIFSHNILALLSLPFILSYMGLLVWKGENKLKLIQLFSLSLVVGIGIASVFWLPAISEKQFVRGLEVYDITQSFPQLYELILPSWGSGFSSDALGSQGMSYQIGVANLLAVFVVLSIYIFKKARIKERALLLFSFLWFLIIIFLLLQSSEPLWKIIPLLHFAQFPWRYLSLMILVCAFMAGSLPALLPKRRVVGVFLIVFVVLTTYSYGKPAYYLVRDDAYYLARKNFTDGTNSPGNVFNTTLMNSSLKKATDPAFFVQGKGKVSAVKSSPQRREIEIVALDKEEIVANTAYFPGWIVYEDGKKINSYPNKDGLISFITPKGKHTIIMVFTDTIVRQVGGMISLLSIAFTLACMYFLRIKMRHENSN